MILILPILVPLVTAALTLVFWRQRVLQRIVSLLGVQVLLGIAIALIYRVNIQGIQVMQVGSWPAPFGITFVADKLSAVMVLLTAISGFVVGIYSLVAIDSKREKNGYHPIFQVLLAAVCGSFLTGDLFNLYVWFELVLMSSFVLLALGGERVQLESSIKYVALNLFASILFLTAVALIYGLVGTLNMADLAVKLSHGVAPQQILSFSMLLFVAFGIKAAVFPLFSWLPASYHTPPIAITAIFAAILTKVGVYSIIRVFSMIFVQDIPYTQILFLITAGLTMLTGVFGAMAQNEFRRILAFHSVSQVGYMLMGLGLYSIAGLAGSILFFIHHSLVKSSLFLISGIVYKVYGTCELKKLGGVQKRFPDLAVLFFICAMSLAGIPPFSGFFAKLALVTAGLNGTHYIIVGVALFVGICTLLSMTKIWAEVFWKKLPDESHLQIYDNGTISRGNLYCLYTPVCLLTLLVVVIGIAAGPIYTFVESAAQQVFNPREYIQRVLGGVK